MSKVSKCPDCGAEVIKVAKPGRKLQMHNVCLPIAHTIEVPTCQGCGEEFYNEKLVIEIEEAE